MITALTIFHAILSVLLIVLVLLQFGKGAELGATMGGGGGASQNVFSSSQQGNIFSKATTGLAALFLINSVLLSVMIAKESKNSIFDGEAPVSAPLNRDAEKAAAKAKEPATKPEAAKETETTK